MTHNTYSIEAILSPTLWKIPLCSLPKRRNLGGTNGHPTVPHCAGGRRWVGGGSETKGSHEPCSVVAGVVDTLPKPVYFLNTFMSLLGWLA